jgi:hypothetical protein
MASKPEPIEAKAKRWCIYIACLLILSIWTANYAYKLQQAKTETAAATADLLNKILADPRSEPFLDSDTPNIKTTLQTGVNIGAIPPKNVEIVQRAAEICELSYYPNLPISKTKKGGFANPTLHKHETAP